MVTYPSDWKECSLNDVIKIKRGASPRPIESYLTFSSSGVRWIKIGDAPRDGKYIVSTAEKITKEGANHSVRVYLGDFILSNSMSFGRPYLLGIDGCIHDGWLRLYDFQNEVDKDFLYYLLSSPSVKGQYESFAAGSGVQNLNKEVVKKVQVFLPELSEQQAIASVLSNFDEHIDDLSELIEKKKAIRDGALDDLVSGRTKVDGFDGDWIESTVASSTSAIITGGTPSTTIDKYWGGTIPWLASTEIHQKIVTKSTRNITEIGLNNSSAKIAPKDSVLIALAGQGKTRGTAAFLAYPMALNQSLAALVPSDKTDPKFLYYLFENMYVDLREHSSGDGGRGGLNKTLIKNINIRLPMEIKEQHAIAEILTAMDEEIESLETEKEKMMQIKEGAMDDLLTGRVRLKV